MQQEYNTQMKAQRTSNSNPFNGSQPDILSSSQDEFEINNDDMIELANQPQEIQYENNQIQQQNYVSGECKQEFQNFRNEEQNELNITLSDRDMRQQSDMNLLQDFREEPYQQPTIHQIAAILHKIQVMSTEKSASTMLHALDLICSEEQYTNSSSVSDNQQIKENNVPKMKGSYPAFLCRDHPDFKPSYHVYDTEYFVKKYSRKKSEKTIIRELEYPKQRAQELERILAYAFLTKEYGLAQARKVLGHQIDNTLFHTLMTNVVRVSFRKMLYLMKTKLKLPVHSFDSVQELIIKSPLVACKKWMSPQDLNTFLNIVCQIYNLKQCKIYQNQIIHLYNTLVRLQKIKDRQIPVFPQMYPNLIVDFRQPIRCQQRPQTTKDNRDNKQRRAPRPVQNNTAVKPSLNIIPQMKKKQQIPKSLQPKQEQKQFHKELRELYLKYSPYGSIKSIAEILNAKYHKKYRPQDYISLIRKQLSKALSKLIQLYNNKRKTTDRLPELILKENHIDFIVHNEANQTFRQKLLDMMQNVDFNSRESLSNLAICINHFIMKQSSDNTRNKPQVNNSLFAD